MRRADRLFQIVQYLRGGRLITAGDLAERLEVSKQTIYRDIADLMSTGVPIDGEAGIGYIMRSVYDLQPLMFNTAEIAALVTGARMLRAWGGVDMAIAAEEALIKIQSVLPAALLTKMAEVQVFSFAHQDMDDDLRHRLDFIETAIKSSHRLIITYRTGEEISSQRTIRPLCQLFWGRVWTVLSLCELRDDYRSFRVDRIQDIKTGDHFKPDKRISLKDFLERERTQAQEKFTHFNAL